MKPLHQVILSAMLLCLSGTQCKKYPPTTDNPYGLPNATQTGAGTFACLVNGQKFIAYYDGTWSGAEYGQDTIGVSGSPKTAGFSEYIGFQVVGRPLQPGTYPIDGIGTYAEFITDSSCLGFPHETSADATGGSIRLTKIDTANKIISGTFQFVFQIPSCDTLKVTEGRFDYHYY